MEFGKGEGGREVELVYFVQSTDEGFSGWEFSS